MSIGVSADQLDLVSTTISIINENLNEVADSLESFTKIMRPKYLGSASVIRYQYNRMQDNTLLWWSDQPYDLQATLLELCLKHHYNKARKANVGLRGLVSA